MERIASEVRVDSADSFSIQGEIGELDGRLEERNAGTAIEGFAGELLIASLREALYRKYYAVIAPPPPSVSDLTLQSTLHEITTRCSIADLGWEVIEVLPDGGVFAQKDSRAVAAAAGSYLGMETPTPRLRGHVSLHSLTASDSYLNGFYFFWGATAQGTPRAGNSIRIYWNCHPEGISEIASQLIESLNSHRIPFRMKLPQSIERLRRRDALVLYVQPNYLRAAIHSVALIHSKAKDYLYPEVPLFTRKLADGLGVAESPSGRSSFGTHRCDLIARGLYSTRGSQTSIVRVAAITASFEKAQVSIEKPYLREAALDPWGLDELAI